MSRRDEQQAYAHPAYDDAVRKATAGAAKGEQHSVYWDGTAIYVRPSAQLPPPPNATCICVADRWDDNTVQLRFAGARSEWVKT